MKKIFLLLFVCSAISASSQELAFGRKIVDTLTSPYFWGRGYTNDGMKKAADFLKSEFRSYGLQPLKGDDYLQKFSYSVNTFPGDMQLSINGKELVPGRDFIVSPSARGVKGSGELFKADSINFVNQKNMLQIRLQDKLTWSVDAGADDFTMIDVNNKAITSAPSEFSANIENKVNKNFGASNVCAMIKGTEQPDSFIFITAHYDHLGGMGRDTYFPGANDNASGVSLLMNLAHYYAQHPQRYSIAFILFAGEEAGLKGSKYFTEHPLVPLKNIRFLINTDLAGTGEDGITVVNASEFPKEFAIMNAINDEYKLLKKINARGKAANSDHYFFTEKGVPAFFFYTLGGIAAYHDVFDKGATLPMTEHEDLFKLVVKFNEKLMNQ